MWKRYTSWFMRENAMFGINFGVDMWHKHCCFWMKSARKAWPGTHKPTCVTVFFPCRFLCVLSVMLFLLLQNVAFSLRVNAKTSAQHQANLIDFCCYAWAPHDLCGRALTKSTFVTADCKLEMIWRSVHLAHKSVEMGFIYIAKLLGRFLMSSLQLCELSCS